MTNFTRNIGDADRLKSRIASSQFLNAIFKQQLGTGKAFLAIRDHEATIYYNGNQLCNMKSNKIYEPCVYSRYLPLLRSRAVSNTKDVEGIAEEGWLKKTGISGYSFESVLPEILDNIEKDSSPESQQVSKLYKYSPLCTLRTGDIILLDVEAAFASSGEKTERIDVVLYHTVEQQLIFVEVKRLSDGRIRETNGAPAEVLTQLGGYQSALTNSDEKANIVFQYNNVISFYNAAFGTTLPPIDVNHKLLLGLLLVEYSLTTKDQDQKKAAKVMIEKDYGFYSVGDTHSIKPETLEALYKAFLKK